MDIFKELEDPPERGALGGFVDLVANRLSLRLEQLAQLAFTNAVHEQGQTHNHRQRDDPFGFL